MIKTPSPTSPDPLLPAASGDLPDVNVWLALATKEHPHHPQAMNYWLKSASERVCFCRITMLGLVRLLSQPRVMGSNALTLNAALAAFDGWSTLPSVDWADEPRACNHWLRTLVGQSLPPRMLTDAYLASLAVASGLRLVSFDADFHRFKPLDLLHLQVTTT